MNRIYIVFTLALLTATTAVRGEDFRWLLQRGDSCMQQYNTFEALKYYQQAFDETKNNEVRIKLADCHYKRANYHQTAELLKNMHEDSLTHEAFRQLANSYKRQGDTYSYVYWAHQLIHHYPMDGEVVAGVTLGFAQLQQPQNGIKHALEYYQKDSTNILVNRALADAYFMDRKFNDATRMYEQLLQQGDSTFNTLYSAGMSYTKIDSLERARDCLTAAAAINNFQHLGSVFRLGVVSIDTQHYNEGLTLLNMATELAKPDTTTMRAITLSQGEGYYLTEQYDKAIEAWKRHLEYNPTSIATYYNLANTYALLLENRKEALPYYRRFLELARQEQNPNPELQDMIQRAKNMLNTY